MSGSKSSTKAIPVVIAVSVVLLLAATLVARLLGRAVDALAAPPAPTASVAAPQSVGLEELEIPCWSCRESREWRVRFRTDLDLLAPLGDGPANAAEFFKDFAKPDGPRLQEAREASDARIDGPDWLGKVIPADHPLLAEAEPWCDQAVMRYYPDVFELDGFETRIPNLLIMLHMAKSWVARGLAADDPEQAMADFRRAIRLGRLLRQEDTVIISDLVGLACIRYGAEGMYRFAIGRGDLELALIASVVVGEVAPQRLLTSERVTAATIAEAGVIEDDGGVRLALKDGTLERVIELAGTSPDRRFRGEAFLTLHVVREYGSSEQRQRTMEVLDELAGDEDEIIAHMARWSRDEPVTEQLLRETFGQG